MRKILFTFARRLLPLLLLPPALAFGQFTTVSGTVIDPNGIPYAGGTITAKLVLSGVTPTLNGGSFSMTGSAGLSKAGSFTMNLADNSVMVPNTLQWSFTVCSAIGTVNPAIGTGSQCFTPAPITISGSSQSISTQLQAAALALTNNPGGGGTVTSVAVVAAVGSPVAVLGSPITTAGTITLTTVPALMNTFFAGPASGAAAPAAFRTLVSADLPAGGSSGQVQFNNSGAFGGDSTFTFNSTSKQVTAGYLATTTGPAIDPMAYGCAGDGTTDDTACWQAAVNYMEAHHGYVTCNRSYKLDRVQLAGGLNGFGYDTIRGGGENQACLITVKTDAVFVSKYPASYEAGITVTDIEFINGVNPIDIPLVNQSDWERLEFVNQTGCGLALIDGERRYISQITSVHNGANGFAALCTGDYTKSLFSGVIPPGPYGVARTVVDHLWELDSLGSSGFSAQWLWYGSDTSNVDSSSGGLSEDTVRDLGCFFGCSKGLLQFGNVYNSTIDVVDTDHIAETLTPVAIGFNIVGCFQNSRVSSYTPNYNGNNMTTQMYVGQFCDGSTIENSWFSSSVDNVTTFGLYIANSAPTGSLISVTGGVYNAGGAVGSQAPADMINVIGSRLVPSNLHGGAILGDQTNKDVEISLLHDTGTGTASTGLFKVMRAPGGFAALTPDLTSSGTLFQLNEALSVNGTLTDTTTKTFETFSQTFTAPWEGLQLTSAAGSVGSNIDLRNSTGTNASPLALLSGQELGALTFNGYNGSAFTTSAAAKINVKAGENWSTSAEGTYILFNSTPDTTTSAVTRGLVDGLGNWEFGAPGGGPLPTGTAYAEFDINGNLIKPESTAPSGIASSDILYADSTAHRWKMLNNNTSGLDLVGIASAGTSGHCLQLAANGIDISDSGSTNCGGGTGTVTSFSSGNLSPLFTTSVATSTTTPALSFSLSNAGAGTIFGNATSSSAAPAFTATPQLGASGTLGSLTMGNATSGLLTLQPATGALGTVTVSIPAATDTLVNLAGTQTLTNKTLSSPVLGGTPDASGATQFKLPVGAGFATLANGEQGYDTTNLNWHAWQNGADSYLFSGPVSGTYTNGDCIKFGVASSVITLVDTGSTCGGAVSSVFTRTGAVVATSGDYTVAQVTGAAPLASPTFTGTVTLPSGQALIAPALGTPASGVLTNTSGYLWNNLAAPTGNLSLTMGSDTSIFNTTTALSQFFAWKNTTAAVVGTSQGSPIEAICGRAFHGSADVEDCLTLKELPGNGNDAAITFTIGHTGTSTGQVITLFPGAIASGVANTNLTNGDIESAESSTTGSLKLGTDNGLEVRRAGGALEFNGASTIHAGGSTVSTDQAMTISGGFQSGGTKFTASGCSNSTTVGGATAGSFASGTTGACTVTITMGSSATATNGWACFASDQTTPANLYDQKTGGSTTTAVLSGTTVSGDVISFGCVAY